MKKLVKESIIKLIEKSNNVYLSTVDEEGWPNTKCMFARDRDGVRTFYLSTNTSSMRVSQIRKNMKACLYFCNEKRFKGLMLKGKIEVCTDQKTRERLWKPTDVMYYPQGVHDDDYCVLKFNAEEGNYYHGLNKEIFQIEELEKE